MESSTNYRKRPIAVSILCVFMVVGLFFLGGKIFAYIRYPDNCFFWFLVGSFLVISTCCFGFCKMKKWAVHLYSIYALLVIIATYFLTGHFNILQAIPSLIIISICFSKIRCMS